MFLIFWSTVPSSPTRRGKPGGRRSGRARNRPRPQPPGTRKRRQRQARPPSHRGDAREGERCALSRSALPRGSPGHPPNALRPPRRDWRRGRGRRGGGPRPARGASGRRSPFPQRRDPRRAEKGTPFRSKLEALTGGGASALRRGPVARPGPPLRARPGARPSVSSKETSKDTARKQARTQQGNKQGRPSRPDRGPAERSPSANLKATSQRDSDRSESSIRLRPIGPSRRRREWPQRRRRRQRPARGPAPRP